MNIRQSITRNITYSIVTVTEEGTESQYTVYGETSPKKEMKQILKKHEGENIPSVSVKTITEKRAISIDDFIKYSTVINESEEN